VTASGQQDWIRDETHGLRRLCPRECAAIQTFPLDWDWGESKSSAYKLIGNAVPPDLAKAIGTRLIEHCDEFSDPMKGLKLVDSLAPLPSDLANAIEYTLREERSNGASRRQAPNRRTSKLAQQYG
jgi:DNA (cytosine-5)-methyltransferase 1